MTDDDDTAHASVTCNVNLDMADHFAGGWKELVLIELDRMRGMMPFADQLKLTFYCERRRDAG